MARSATSAGDDEENTDHKAGLEEARALPETVLFERLAITDYRTAGFIPTEVLVAMFRSAHLAGSRNHTERMAGILTARMSRLAKKTLGPYSGARQRFTNLDEAVCDLVSYVWEIMLDNPKRAVHAERRFGQFFRRQAIDFMRAASAAKRDKVTTFTDELGDAIDDDGRLPEEVLGISDENDIDPAEWVEYKQVVQHANLTEDEQKAAILYFAFGFPLESNKPNQSSISQLMGKTQRTIHNYLKSAREKLRSAMK